GECRDRTLPVVLSRDSQGMGPCIVGVELETVPGALPQIHLESVVIRVALRDQLAKREPRTNCIRIHLEEVDGITCARNIDARIGGTRRECCAPNQVTVIERRVGEGICESSSLSGLKIANKPATAELGRVAGEGGVHNRERSGPRGTAVRAVCETGPAI